MSPGFCVQCCQLLWQRWESRHPSGGPERGCVQKSGTARPDPACNETQPSWEGNPACRPPQTKNQAASCQPVMLLLPLHWLAFFFFFSFSIVGATWKGGRFLQLGQWPCGAQCKYINLFIHLFNIYQKLAMCPVLCKVFGMQCCWDTLSTQGPL